MRKKTERVFVLRWMTAGDEIIEGILSLFYVPFSFFFSSLRTSELR